MLKATAKSKRFIKTFFKRWQDLLQYFEMKISSLLESQDESLMSYVLAVKTDHQSVRLFVLLQQFVVRDAPL